MAIKNIFLIVVVLIPILIGSNLYAPSVGPTKAQGMSILAVLASGVAGATAGGRFLASKGSALGEALEPVLGPLARPIATLSGGGIGAITGAVVGLYGSFKFFKYLLERLNKSEYKDPNVSYPANHPKPQTKQKSG